MMNDLRDGNQLPPFDTGKDIIKDREVIAFETGGDGQKSEYRSDARVAQGIQSFFILFFGIAACAFFLLAIYIGLQIGTFNQATPLTINMLGVELTISNLPGAVVITFLAGSVLALLTWGIAKIE